ncbi:MAG: hypothetical protein V5A68_07035 [Candidatus Thermoplasmatota archaeon]
MSSRKIRIKNIKKQLSNSPETWVLNGRADSMDCFISLQKFLLEQKEKKSDISLYKKTKDIDVPYHASIFHFLMYHSFYPKVAFIKIFENSVVFGAFKGRYHNEIEFSFPTNLNSKSSLINLKKILSDKNIISLIDELKIDKILLRNIDDEFLKIIRKNNDKNNLEIESISELKYSVYDIKKTLSLKGKKYANLRWHLNKFHKEKHKIEIVDIEDTLKAIIHLIGQWKKKAIEERDFSFIDVRSDKIGAKIGAKYKKYNDNIDDFLNSENILTRVLKVDGVVSAFNLGYPLGIFQKRNIFAHAIGIADISIPHLAEYAQYDFWRQIKKKGYRLVNDGPTWRNSLETYKNKFRPIDKKRYFWVKLSTDNLKKQ